MGESAQGQRKTPWAPRGPGLGLPSQGKASTGALWPLTYAGRQDMSTKASGTAARQGPLSRQGRPLCEERAAPPPGHTGSSCVSWRHVCAHVCMCLSVSRRDRGGLGRRKRSKVEIFKSSHFSEVIFPKTHRRHSERFRNSPLRTARKERRETPSTRSQRGSMG